MQKITVLYILDPATTGGATKSALSLIERISNFSVTPIVCTSSQNKINEYLTSKGIINLAIGHREMITEKYSGNLKSHIRNFLITGRYLLQDIRALRALRPVIKSNKIDLIHTNSTRSDIGFLISLFYRIPHLVHIREFGDLDYNCHPLNPFYIHYYNVLAERFICVSNAVKNHWIKKGLQKDKLVVIYNGIDPSTITTSSYEHKRQQYLRIVMCGSLRPSKGQHLAIEAIGKLPDDIKRNVEIDFIGWTDSAYSKYLMELAGNWGIEEKVHILSPEKDVLPLLGNYDIGLMCSQAEGFGRVTAEFMHAKLGVIASDSGANPELITHNKEGLIFENGNAESLAEMIALFYSNRQLLIDCASAAAKKASEIFTSSINASSIFKLYEEILNTH